MMNMTGGGSSLASVWGTGPSQTLSAPAEQRQSPEAQTRAEQRMESTQAILDTNAMTSRAEMRFAALDLDQDGALSTLEMNKMRPNLPPGTGGQGVDFAQVMVEHAEKQSEGAMLQGDNPVGRFLAAMRALRGF